MIFPAERGARSIALQLIATRSGVDATEHSSSIQV